ncbi:carboxypeptidase-like regulatory domain-containing protein [Polaribacter sp.]|nr:carboxypeptidase-like regulatory domain-containing protein [Polaribacter sp.]
MQKKNHKLNFIFITLLIFSNFFYAQNKNITLKGSVIDEAGDPLPFVAVSVINKSVGTATTEDGDFLFVISKKELKDSISISSLGFDPLIIKVEDFLNLKDKKLTLVAVATTLDEIVLLKTEEYVFNAIKNLEKNTISTPYQMDILFRRATTEGGVSKFLVENFLKVRDKGPSNRPNIFQVAESRKSADYRIFKRKIWRHDFWGVYNLNPFRPHSSQHKVNLKKFIWKRVGDSSYEGEDVIIVEGKKDWRKIKLFIGIDTYKVYRIERGKTLYIYKSFDEKRLVLSYYKNEWKLQAEHIPNRYKNTDVANTTYKTEGFVYKIESNKKRIDVNPFGEETDMGLIKLPYNAKFWNNLRLPPDTKFYKTIKKGLESNFGVPLETQFELVNK